MTLISPDDVNNFQIEDSNGVLRYFRADNQDNSINKPPQRAHLDVVKEAKLST